MLIQNWNDIPSIPAKWLLDSQSRFCHRDLLFIALLGDPFFISERDVVGEQFEEGFASASMSAQKNGEVQGPMKTEFGYHLVEVTKRVN